MMDDSFGAAYSKQYYMHHLYNNREPISPKINKCNKNELVWPGDLIWSVPQLLKPNTKALEVQLLQDFTLMSLSTTAASWLHC